MKSGKSRYKKIYIDGKTYSLHRYLMEQHLGRPLLPTECVHHINGDRYDNRIENLQVVPFGQHSSHHNSKYPKVKTCVVCGAEFEPKPTKRKIALTCSWECRSRLLSVRVSDAYEREPELRRSVSEARKRYIARIKAEEAA